MLENRYGKFSISDVVMLDHTDIVSLVMKDLIVLEATHSLYKQLTDYVAVSKHFDIVEEGQAVNEYKVIIEENKNVKFEKI